MIKSSSEFLAHKFDVIVIGSGPAGLNAAQEAADCGARVLLIEREQKVGGACVRYGTIPSKTIRETASALTAFQRRSGGVYRIQQDQRLSITSLLTRLDQVVHAHQQTSTQQLQRAGVEVARGRASFVSPYELQIQQVTGQTTVVHGNVIVIATGSSPREPDGIHVDHENILDSDSLLSMTYLPRTLLVLGSGVIACEYASTFAALGVDVTIVDKYPAPLGFLDPELVAVFQQRFEENGGTFRGNSPLSSMTWDGVSHVVTCLVDGDELRTDKALVAQGRIANLAGLNIERAGLKATDRGLLAVNSFCQTTIPHIYAVGDTIGPPALASSSMEQGRRAMCHALSREISPALDLIPTGIYTIPELSTVGLDESQARRQVGSVMVGRADFEQLARAHITATPTGVLKLIADGTGRRLLGVQIAGEGATELIHQGQMALIGNMSVDTFATSIFNFPTMAEAYRLAALDIIHQREQQSLRPAREDRVRDATMWTKLPDRPA